MFGAEIYDLQIKTSVHLFSNLRDAFEYENCISLILQTRESTCISLPTSQGYTKRFYAPIMVIGKNCQVCPLPQLSLVI